MVSAHNYNAKVWGVKVDVNVKQEVLRYSRDANRGPRLSILHRWIRIDVIEKDSYIYYNLCYQNLCYLVVSYLLFDLGL